MNKIDDMLDQARNNGRGSASSYHGFKWAADTLRQLRELVKKAKAGASYGSRHDSRFPYQGPTVEIPEPLWDKIRELLK